MEVEVDSVETDSKSMALEVVGADRRVAECKEVDRWVGVDWDYRSNQEVVCIGIRKEESDR